jgi:hypothetical protein
VTPDAQPKESAHLGVKALKGQQGAVLALACLMPSGGICGTCVLAVTGCLLGRYSEKDTKSSSACQLLVSPFSGNYVLMSLCLQLLTTNAFVCARGTSDILMFWKAKLLCLAWQ